MTSKKIIVLFFMTLGQMSCVSLERSPSSGYKDWQEAGSEEISTFNFRNERSSPKRQRSEVEALEMGIRTESENEYYKQAKPILKTAKEKKEFLSQRDRNSQKRWLASRGISELSLFDPNVREAIDEGDVVLGMTKEAVLKSWGDPEAIEVAGNPDYGNERWVYTDYEGSAEGYQKQQRLLYFQRGKVVGWETH